MLFREINIANIAITAGKLIQEGRIQMDELKGHEGLAEAITEMADMFWVKFGGLLPTDLDYSAKIKEFAEEQLLEKYGVEQQKEFEPLQLKVVIDNGIVEDVLKDQDIPVKVEVVRIDKDYEDYEQLCDYRDELYADQSLRSCDYSFADFTDEPDLSGAVSGAAGNAAAKHEGEQEEAREAEQIYCLCEEYEDDDAIRQFQILGISRDREYLRKLMEARIAADPYGFVKNNGVYMEGEDYFSTEYASGFVGYQILDEKVLSREDLERLIVNEVGEESLEKLEDPVRVYAVANGGVRKEVFSGDLDACNQFFENHKGIYQDENGFVWELDIVDSRELPDGYYDALDHYSEIIGFDIENEFVVQHAEELVFCYENNKEISVFNSWARYEKLLGEGLSYDEFCAIDESFDGDPFGISVDDVEVLDELKAELKDFRERDPYLFTCLGDKEFMFLVRGVDREDAEKTGKEWYEETFFEPGHFSCWRTDKDDYEELSTQNVIESDRYSEMVKEKPLHEKLFDAKERSVGDKYETAVEREKEELF